MEWSKDLYDILNISNRGADRDEIDKAFYRKTEELREIGATEEIKREPLICYQNSQVNCFLLILIQKDFPGHEKPDLDFTIKKNRNSKVVKLLSYFQAKELKFPLN